MQLELCKGVLAPRPANGLILTATVFPFAPLDNYSKPFGIDTFEYQGRLVQYRFVTNGCITTWTLISEYDARQSPPECFTNEGEVMRLLRSYVEERQQRVFVSGNPAIATLVPFTGGKILKLQPSDSQENLCFVRFKVEDHMIDDPLDIHYTDVHRWLALWMIVIDGIRYGSAPAAN